MENIGYNLVGQGDQSFPDHWMRDNRDLIFQIKTKYYDMYTFHYWLWKTNLKHLMKIVDSFSPTEDFEKC